MSFTQELGSNLHMINDIVGHSDKTAIDNHVTNILEHIDHSDNIFDAVQVAQKVQNIPVQPTIPDKGITLDNVEHTGQSGASRIPRMVSSGSVMPGSGIPIVNDTMIPHNQQTQIQCEVIQPSTQLTTIPKKKVSFQSEVHVVEPQHPHIVPRSGNEVVEHQKHQSGSDCVSHAQETTSQNPSQNLTNINNIVGFKMSISTLYFVGLLIIVGVVAYFQQKRK